jgi:hypothetical protein
LLANDAGNELPECTLLWNLSNHHICALSVTAAFVAELVVRSNMTTSAEKPISAPHVKLTDEVWEEIAKRFKLGPEARHPIEGAISHFEVMESTLDPSMSPASTQQALQNMAALAGELGEGLQALLSNRLALVSLTRATSTKGDFESAMDSRTAQTVFAAEIAALSKLKHSLQAAGKAVVKAGPGAHRQAVLLAMFVKMLDNIYFQCTGQYLKRDSKGMATGRDFVAVISDAAGLKIGRGSIDEALKQVVKGRGGVTGRGTS